MSRARDFADLAGSADAGGLTGRNLIINGAVRINQRNAGTVNVNATNNGYTTADRWQANRTADDKYSIQVSTDAPDGFDSSLLATSLSAYSVSSSDIFFLQQSIEGNNCVNLAFGSSAAKSITLSFFVKSSLTGTFGGCLANAAHNRSYPFSYSISSANTWELKAVTIAGDTSGTWLTTNGVGLQVIFGLGGGSTRSGAAGAWNSNTNYTADGAVSVVGTSGATFYITGVQLEVGQATPFEHRSFGDELARCQRYFERSYEIGTATGTATSNGSKMFQLASSTTALYPSQQNFSIVKRAAPTMVAYSPNSGNSGNIRNGSGGTDVTVSSITDTSASSTGRINLSSSSTDGHQYHWHWTADAEL